MNRNDGVWVYAVTTDDSFLDGISEIRGVAGEELRMVADCDIAAVVGSVDLDEYGEEALRRNLEDLDWLSETARRHDAVVSAVCAGGATIPLRLATVYFDDDRVRAMLCEQAESFTRVLDRIADRAEWGVRVYGDPHAFTEQSTTAGATGKPSGTEYLMRRRAQAAARKDAETIAGGRADDIYAELAKIAVAGTRQPPSPPSLSPHQAWEILNATYLVDDRRTREFATAVDDINARLEDVEVLLTGPWPPYSFTADETSSR